ncbi:MAG: helicase-related protein [Eubacterium sp.]
MSATPIPRTLGLNLYGDLDISILDELPPGRQTVRTDVVDSRYHKRLYKFIKDAVARGEQCYIVCPAVEENETNIKSAEEFAKELANGEFKGYNLGILHGKMKAKDKEAIMKSFADGTVSILVATTVVEVGVDVPNATIMVIENAERLVFQHFISLEVESAEAISKATACLCPMPKAKPLVKNWNDDEAI